MIQPDQKFYLLFFFCLLLFRHLKEANSHDQINMTKFWLTKKITMANVNNWTWPKNLQQQMLTIEHDLKYLFSSFYCHLSRLRLETRLLLILLYLPCTPTTLERLDNRLFSRKHMSYWVVFGRNDYKRALFWVVSGRSDQERSRFFVGYSRTENRPKSFPLSLLGGGEIWTLNLPELYRCIIPQDHGVLLCLVNFSGGLYKFWLPALNMDQF